MSNVIPVYTTAAPTSYLLNPTSLGSGATQNVQANLTTALEGYVQIQWTLTAPTTVSPGIVVILDVRPIVATIVSTSELPAPITLSIPIPAGAGTITQQRTLTIPNGLWQVRVTNNTGVALSNLTMWLDVFNGFN